MMLRTQLFTLFAAAAATSLSACGDDPTNVEVLKVNLPNATQSLDAIDRTVQLTVSITLNDRLLGSDAVPTWSSTNGGVAGVSTGGLVTAIANGDAWIRARYEGASDSVKVEVRQEGARLELVGPSLAGRVGQRLDRLVAVQLVDANGHSVLGGGFRVEFAIVSGGGAISPNATTTDLGGRATADWTLGPLATSSGGMHQLRASGGGLVESLVVAAEALPGSASTMELHDGRGQWGYPGSTLPGLIEVRVKDGYANGVGGVGVAFSVVNGMTSPPTGVSQVSGVVGTAWTLGAAVPPETPGYRNETLRVTSSQFPGAEVLVRAEVTRAPGGAVRATDFGGQTVIGKDPDDLLGINVGVGGGFDPVPSNNRLTFGGVQGTVDSVLVETVAPLSGLVTEGGLLITVPVEACPSGPSYGGLLDVPFSVEVRGVVWERSLQVRDDRCPRITVRNDFFGEISLSPWGTLVPGEVATLISSGQFTVRVWSCGGAGGCSWDPYILQSGRDYVVATNPYNTASLTIFEIP